MWCIERCPSRTISIEPLARICLNIGDLNVFPKAAGSDLAKTARYALLGGLAAGVFGILHDQITYTISPEYFTRMKFDQFRNADFGFPPRILVAEIGFLATWWVGLLGTWFLARIAMVKSADPATEVARAWVKITGITLLAAGSGYFLGPSLLTFRPEWSDALSVMKVTQPVEFCQVAGIHLASYTGAFLSWAWMIWIFFKAPDKR